MSKFVSTIIGGIEIAGGVVAGALGNWQLGGYLIAAGAGTVISGLGTLLSKGPVQGFATTIRNPTAPWDVIYGRTRTGGRLTQVSLPSPDGGRH
jgi:hypothetical protein